MRQPINQHPEGIYMKRLIVSLILSFALIAPIGAFAAEEAQTIDRVVAVVGNEVITLSELQTEMAPTLEHYNQTMRGDELARATEKLKRDTMNSLVEKYLQLQEASLQGIEVDKADIDRAIGDIMKRNNMDMAGFTQALMAEGYSVDDYKRTLVDQLKIIKLVARTVKSKIVIDEQEIKDYYKENKDSFAAQDEVRVANIFFPAEKGNMDKALENAKAARAQVMAGTSFEEMAATCTGKPEAAKTCVLGTFAKGELSKEVDEVIFKMSAGEVSQPVKVANGYQLLKAMERSTSSAKTIDEVKPQIIERLNTKKGEAIFAQWIQDLRKRTYVEIRR